MLCLFVMLITLLLVAACASAEYSYDYGHDSSPRQYTQKIVLKQGELQGMVVEPKVNRALPPVEQYLGIPYAAAPVGELRFMPSGSAPVWFGVKVANTMGPVCPQKFPSTSTMDPTRKAYFHRLAQYLQNQSEDCLYLNIYSPVKDTLRPYTKYPVMVFIHGESFEWNSGNPYDGSVLAAYGKVVVVTLNFRLGVLGFLRVGLEDNSRSNFGLVDQLAALLWIQENIEAFGGNKDSVTLFGHGTGAACINFLMMSPVVAGERNPLFHRAILMGGTALSDWALASTARQVTYQVAESLNCPTDDKLAACLRKKRLNDIVSVSTMTHDYTTRFGPVVDGNFIPSDPAKIMRNFNDFLRRFELMYGVTEVESVHLLPSIALPYGMKEDERNQELHKYLYTRCEYKPEIYLQHTLAVYDSSRLGYTGHEPDRASLARDTLLDILSDARSAAPVVQMGKYHAAVNSQSYFYVFGHTTMSRKFIRNKTGHGEELPYVFGVPLDGPKFHFVDVYNNQERLFSEAIMALWTNFARQGDPNIPTKDSYLTSNALDWQQYNIYWPEFNSTSEQYMYLAIPPNVRQKYRSREISYWNDILPDMMNNRTLFHFISKITTTTPFPLVVKPPPRGIPPWFPYAKGTSVYNKPERKPNEVAYGTVKLKPDEDVPVLTEKKEFGKIKTSPTQAKSSTAMIVLIIVGGVFLLVNMILFIGLYYKCVKLKHRETTPRRTYEDTHEHSPSKMPKFDDELENGCSIMKMISKSSKSGETYEAVRLSDDESSKYKLSRQMSASTIDPHTKVRDWIAQEIVQKCSPKFLRKPKQEVVNNFIPKTHVRNDSKATDYSTLGKSPTRPVSPVEEIKITNIPVKFKGKAEKVSIGIDATPSARSPSVLRQEPIEFSKSFDYGSPIRRSATLDNFPRNSNNSLDDIKASSEEPIIVKIEHHKSKSEPIQDSFGCVVYAVPGKKMTTFDPNNDVNVTSREDGDAITPLTPEESLMTIKRRNFPKVLPDYPDKQALVHKRRSMPAPSHLFLPIPENSSFSQPNSPTQKLPLKQPPAPPPRSCSTLDRKLNSNPAIQSPVMLAEEPPEPEEPEITCNNLYVGPILPSRENRRKESSTLPKNMYLDTQPIYGNLRNVKDEGKKVDKPPKTIITTDPDNPIKKVEPKVIIKPTATRITDKDKSRTIPRVTAKDNVADPIEPNESQNKSEEHIKTANKTKVVSQIPILIKTSNPNLNKESSSESSPSEESETGTVIKRV